MSETIDDLKDAEKEKLETDHGDRHSNRGNVTGGLVLITIGVIFLLSQITGFHINNWWALFIMIPAVFKLNEAWQGYQSNGRFTDETRNALFGGLMLATVAGFFLFNIGWNLFWPLVLIMIGLGALLNGRS
ncbi:MAG: hypothetical protein H6657_31750 [Ardenticatenaceae bacterium]|nr:hypothetical protein [Ardenticatenaceae bacterium]